MERTETKPFASTAAPPETAAHGRTRADRIRIEQHSGTGLLWLIGWLFTIGFLHLPFWKGVLALFVWPFYLGTTFRALLP